MKIRWKLKSMGLCLFIFPLCFQAFSKNEPSKIELARMVKKEFLHAWNAYKKYAWGHDALKPLTKSYRNWHRESLLMTPVDAFDTLVLMGLNREAKEAKELIFKNLSFSKDFYVKNFEITIRMLGGLISGYQLTKDERFLKLAVDLGNRLLPAFDSPTKMPYVFVNLKTGATKGKVNNPAEIGTLMIEFGTLTGLTKNPVYYQKAKKAVKELFNRGSKIGLVGTNIDVETGEWKNTTAHIGGMIDSYYEYLLKAWLLFKDKDFKVMWEKSIHAVNKYLSDETKNGLWYGHSDMNSGKRTETNFGALHAFFPAVLALSGDLNRARRLQASCFKMWQLHGIEPETIDYSTMKVINPQYVLRPENIESAYYLYKYTKDKKFLKMGKTYFKSLIKYCKTESGYAHLKSVITKEKSDNMESFFLAETLKYLYLLFSPEKTLNFEKYIFNTEAHPIEKTN